MESVAHKTRMIAELATALANSAVLCVAVACVPSVAQSVRTKQPPEAEVISAPGTILPLRQYHEGEKLFYRMKGTNRDRTHTVTYEVQANGVVKKDAGGRHMEEYGWSGLVRDGVVVRLDPAAINFRETLSLERNYPLSVPNLAQVILLIGPITDLLTFYADVSVARQGQSSSVGDHFYFKHGTPNSWADGTYVILGQDSIDFDVTLTAIHTVEGTLSLRVRHVPPEKPEISLPATWMREPVADTPNNWVEVSKTADGKYTAAVGKETFDVVLTISLANGRIVSGSIDNPVQVMERDCADAALASCGNPVRYEIRRQVEIDAQSAVNAAATKLLLHVAHQHDVGIVVTANERNLASIR